MAPAFDSTSPHAQPLGVVVSRLCGVQREARAVEARRIQILSDAYELAHAESSRLAATNPASAAAELAYRTVRSEVAAALHLSEHTVDRHMADAYTLTHHYAATFAALNSGQVGFEHCRVIITAGKVIGDDGLVADTCTSAADESPHEIIALRRAAYEQAVSEYARVETPQRLRPIAQRLAETFAERTFDERHSQACMRRRVYVVEHTDGMSDLVAHLPTVEAYAIKDRLTRMAQMLEGVERSTSAEPGGPGGPGGPGVDTRTPAGADASEGAAAAGSEARRTPNMPSHQRRTRDQLRTDLLSDLLLNSDASEAAAPSTTAGDASVSRTGGAHEAIRARVQVIVTDEALFTDLVHRAEAPHRSTGLHTPPAELVGAGSIDTATAQELASSAPAWELIHHHPVTGDVLRVESYRPSAQLRRLLAARDIHCRFPGCRVPVDRCDIDHTVAAVDGGETSNTNLAHLCRVHHTLKHHSGWRVNQARDGTLDWVSPAGRSYQERPPSRVRFQTSHSPAPPVPF